MTKNIRNIAVFAIAASLAMSAAALPPPVALSVTIVASWRDGGPEQNHTKMLVEALAEENWIKLSPAPYMLTPEQRTECTGKGKEAAACFRSLNNSRPAIAAPPHVILYVTGESHRANITCIGNGMQPSNPARQSAQIDIKAALFAQPAERQSHRVALVSCLISAQGEVR